MDMLPVDLKHEVTYQISRSAAVEDVAKSLIANERLIYHSLQFLSACVDGLSVGDVQVRVGKVSQNSPLDELFVVTCWATYQSDLTRIVPKFVEKYLGINVDAKHYPVITLLTMLLALQAGKMICTSVFPEKEIPNLTINLENMIYVAGDVIDVSAERIASCVEDYCSGEAKQDVKKAAVDFFRPSKIEGVSIQGPLGLKISDEAVREFPSDVDLQIDEDAELVATLRGVTVEIRATDMDRKNSGWHAVIPQLTKRRVKMKIDPTITTETLWGKTEVQGDVVVISKKDVDGVYQPTVYHLIEISG